MKKMPFLFLTLASCFCLVSCEEEESTIIGQGINHDSSAWFSEDELTKVGLSGLSAPTGCLGELSTSVTWFNDGYSFHQPCGDESVLETNAAAYFSYFQSNYGGKFGLSKPYAYGTETNTTYYRIVADSELSSYKETNPSPLYKFYYVRDDALAEDNYLNDDAVWSLDIRYEKDSSGEYFLKIFIENEHTNHNGSFTDKFIIA